MIIILTLIKNGDEIDLEKMGLECIDFIVESLNPLHEFNVIQGNDGIARIDTTYDARTIHTKFYLHADGNDDFITKRDQIYKLFRQRDELTLIHKKQSHKRWIVQLKTPFVIDNELSPNDDLFELEFISKTIYALGGLTTAIKRTDNNKFIVTNHGDFIVDGREHNLNMSFKGKSDKLHIRNNTNGTEWKYTGTTTATNSIELKMVYPYKNGVNIFENTNSGYFELEQGENEIETLGAIDDYSISFEFNPLYI